jgi:hypothetical protein
MVLTVGFLFSGITVWMICWALLLLNWLLRWKKYTEMELFIETKIPNISYNLHKLLLFYVFIPLK